MELKYNYIHFVKLYREGSRAKLPVYVCRNNRSEVELGLVKWNSGWRQYCFFPAKDTIFSKSCMVDINDFITQLTEQYFEDRARQAILARAKKVVF